MADIESKAILKRCIEARAALSSLDQAARQIPNQHILINTLPVLEAQSSSAIENIVTTADRLFEHLESRGPADPATREALRYREALMEGYRSLKGRPLGTRTAEAICTRLSGAEMRVREVPGTKLQNSQTGEITYTPPEGEDRLRAMLANWERFMHGEEPVDPLIRLAVGHYQFEAIHPFTDGNGRTGRILNSLYLVERELLSLPILYLSRYIIHNKTEYYRLLLEVTRSQAWESWIVFILCAVRDTAEWTLARINAIRALAEETRRFVRARLPKTYSHELVDLLFVQPYCRISTLTEAGVAKRQAASKYLKELESIGVLESRKSGRELLFVHRKLMDLLTNDGTDFHPYPASSPS